jgi:hypothetical protein
VEGGLVTERPFLVHLISNVSFIWQGEIILTLRSTDNPGSGGACYGLSKSDMVAWVKEFSDTYRSLTHRFESILYFAFPAKIVVWNTGTLLFTPLLAGGHSVPVIRLRLLRIIPSGSLAIRPLWGRFPRDGGITASGSKYTLTQALVYILTLTISTGTPISPRTLHTGTGTYGMVIAQV